MIWGLYHGADLDGQCSGAILARYHAERGEEIQLQPVGYGEEIDLDRFGADDTVYVADFSLQPGERMLELAQKAHLIWIDHHQTAIDFAAAHEELVAAAGLRRVGNSAAELAWEFLYDAKTLPKAVRLIGRYDVWDDSDGQLWREKILPFQYGMRAIADTDPRTAGKLWTALFVDADDTVFTVMREGAPVLRYQERLDRERAAQAYDTTLDGHRALALNGHRANMQAFEGIWDPRRYELMIAYSHVRGEFWTISLYTTRDDVDVAAVAQARGGGGHRQAAGFQADQLPFKPEVLPDLEVLKQEEREPTLRDPKITQSDADRLMGPMELDLVAYYGQLESVLLAQLEEAIDEGLDPDELIRRAEALLA